MSKYGLDASTHSRNAMQRASTTRDSQPQTTNSQTTVESSMIPNCEDLSQGRSPKPSVVQRCGMRLLLNLRQFTRPYLNAKRRLTTEQTHVKLLSLDTQGPHKKRSRLMVCAFAYCTPNGVREAHARTHTHIVVTNFIIVQSSTLTV